MEKFLSIFALVSAVLMTALAPNYVIAQTSAAQAEQEKERDGDVDDVSASDHARKFAGAVFAMTNATAGNRIVIYGRAEHGSLTRLGSVSTRGLGIGVDTDTQGVLRLSSDNRFLYAANPGSDDISVFSVSGTKLKFLQKIYAGDEPLSLTIHGNLLYVLDGSVAGNAIQGFKIAQDGTLTSLPNSFRFLSSGIAVPGDIRFSPNGRLLVVPHKGTDLLLTPPNAIDVFTVDANGYASAEPIRNASVGLRPFALAFRKDGKLAMIEAVNGGANLSTASSYQLNADGTLKVISASVPNGQTDSCWLELSKDERYAFTANFSSGTISSYNFEPSGALTLIKGAAAFLGEASEPVDLSLSADGRYLYQLLRGPGAVAAFRIEKGAELTPLGVIAGGLPVGDGVSGLAAY